MPHLFVATLMLFFSALTAFAQQSYVLEPRKSDVGFIYQLEGVENRGSMPIKSAEISLDFDALTRSRVDVTVDVSRTKTGFIFATEALKARSVLDAARHPTIRFVSKAVRLSGQGRLSDGAEIDGSLTVRGVTKPVTLKAALFRQRGSEAGDLSSISRRGSAHPEKARKTTRKVENASDCAGASEYA